MFNPVMQKMVADERRRDVIRQAEARRLARQGREGGRSVAFHIVVEFPHPPLMPRVSVVRSVGATH